MDWAERFIKTVVYPKWSKTYVIYNRHNQMLIFNRASCIWFAAFEGAKSLTFDEINNVAMVVWDE